MEKCCSFGVGNVNLKLPIDKKIISSVQQL